MTKGRKNSFDSLRLLGALIVLFGHAFIITGAAQPTLGGVPLHHLGVCIFFSISGYLITQSWSADRNFSRYIQKRALRIFPALIVVVSATALVIGPAVTTQPLARYFSQGWTFRYIASNSVLVTSWSLPGVFDNLPLSGQANGSLWSLPIEFSLYLLAPFLVAAGRRLRRFTPLALIGAGTLVLALQPHAPRMFDLTLKGLNVGWGLATAPYFWCGAALSLLQLESWDGRVRRAALLASTAALVLWITLSPFVREAEALAVLPISLIVLVIGLGDRLHLPALDRIGDISYGLYLWAFPMQQLVMFKLGGGPFLNMAVATPATLLLALMSWRAVERPALRLKPTRRVRTPGRASSSGEFALHGS